MKVGDVAEVMRIQHVAGQVLAVSGDLGTVTAVHVEHGVVAVDYHRANRVVSCSPEDLKVLDITAMFKKARDLMRQPTNMYDAVIDFRVVLSDDGFFKVYATDAENCREVLGEGETVDAALENLLHWNFN